MQLQYFRAPETTLKSNTFPFDRRDFEPRTSNNKLNIDISILLG